MHDAVQLAWRGFGREGSVHGFNLVLLHPALASIQGLSFQAVITGMNTNDVNIQNLTVDASNNTISGCNVGLAGVHFCNASGRVDRSTVIGAKLQDPQTAKCYRPEMVPEFRWIQMAPHLVPSACS
jgi:hypothetical protein